MDNIDVVVDATFYKLLRALPPIRTLPLMVVVQAACVAYPLWVRGQV